MHELVRFFSGLFLQAMTVGMFGGLLAVSFGYASQAESWKLRLAMVPMVGMILVVAFLGLRLCSHAILQQMP